MRSTVADRLREHGIVLRSHAVGDHHVACPRASTCGARDVRDPCLSLTIKADRSAVWQCHRGHCGWVGHVPSDEQADEEEEPRRWRRPTYVAPATPDQRMLKFFRDRGIFPSTVRRAQISGQRVWMPGPNCEVDAIAFPFFRDGAVVNVKYRSYDKEFRQEKGAEKILYGLDDLRGHDVGIIVEGEVDKLSFADAGIDNVVSVPDGAPDPKTWKGGGGKKFDFLRNCADEIERIGKWIICVDNDEPGRLLAAELVRRIGAEKCWRVQWPELNDAPAKDANDVLQSHGAAVLMEMIDAATPYPIDGVTTARDHRDEIDVYYDEPAEEHFELPWRDLRNHYKVGREQLVVVTGIPGSGKSEFVENVCVNLARLYGWKFAIASFEHRMKKFVPRLAEKFLDLPFRPGPRPHMTKDELHDAEDWLDRHFIHIRADAIDVEPTIEWVLDRASAVALRQGIDALVIDPWNELETQKPPDMLESEYLGKCLRRVKRYAWNHKMTVFIVAHPSKPSFNAKGDMNKITLYSISGGAMWFNKCDVGIVVTRVPVADKDDRGEPTLSDIDVQKMKWKQSGAVGRVRLSFDRATGVYKDGPAQDENPSDYDSEEDLQKRADTIRNKGAPR